MNRSPSCRHGVEARGWQSDRAPKGCNTAGSSSAFGLLLRRTLDIKLTSPSYRRSSQPIFAVEAMRTSPTYHLDAITCLCQVSLLPCLSEKSSAAILAFARTLSDRCLPLARSSRLIQVATLRIRHGHGQPHRRQHTLLEKLERSAQDP